MIVVVSGLDHVEIAVVENAAEMAGGLGFGGEGGVEDEVDARLAGFSGDGWGFGRAVFELGFERAPQSGDGLAAEDFGTCGEVAAVLEVLEEALLFGSGVEGEARVNPEE